MAAAGEILIRFTDDRPRDRRLANALCYLVRTIGARSRLDLSALASVIVAPTIREATNFGGARSWSALTEIDDAAGATFTEAPDGHPVTSVALTRERVGLLLDRDRAREAVHVLHHELAHAHDHLVTYDMVEVYANPSGARLLPGLVVMMWAEYFAARRSGSTVSPEQIEQRAAALAHVVREHGPALLEIAALSRDTDDPASLLEAGLRIVQEWLYATALTLGYLDAHGIDASCHPALDDALRDSPFVTTWTDLTEILPSLYKRHGNWTTVAVFDPLAETVQDFLARHDLGIGSDTLVPGTTCPQRSVRSDRPSRTPRPTSRLLAAADA